MARWMARQSGTFVREANAVPPPCSGRCQVVTASSRSHIPWSQERSFARRPDEPTRYHRVDGTPQRTRANRAAEPDRHRRVTRRAVTYARPARRHPPAQPATTSRSSHRCGRSNSANASGPDVVVIRAGHRPRHAGDEAMVRHLAAGSGTRRRSARLSRPPTLLTSATRTPSARRNSCSTRNVLPSPNTNVHVTSISSPARTSLW